MGWLMPMLSVCHMASWTDACDACFSQSSSTAPFACLRRTSELLGVQLTHQTCLMVPAAICCHAIKHQPLSTPEASRHQDDRAKATIQSARQEHQQLPHTAHRAPTGSFSSTSIVSPKD